MTATTDLELETLVQSFALWNDILATDTIDPIATETAVGTLSAHVARDALMLHLSPRLAAHLAGLSDSRMDPFIEALSPIDYDPAEITRRALHLETVAVSQPEQNADMCLVVAVAHFEDRVSGDPQAWLDAALHIDPDHLGAQYVATVVAGAGE